MEIASLSNAFTPQLHHYNSLHYHVSLEKRRISSHCWNHRHVSYSSRFKCQKRDALVQTQYCSSNDFISAHDFTQNKVCVNNSEIEKLIKEFTLKGYHGDAVSLYLDMLDNGFIMEEFHSFPVLVKAIGCLNDLKLSRQIHGHLWKLGVVKDNYVANSLLSTLWKCSTSDDAIKMFKTMQERDSVSWSTMISGFHQSRLYTRSLEWFRCMVWGSGAYPNRVACLSAVSSCASVKSLMQGREIHAFVIKSGLDVDAFMLNGLLEMYMKCGRVGHANRLFESIDDNARENSVLWNVMILGYVDNDCFSEALLCFIEMMVSGIEPDSSTMVAVLVLCSELTTLPFGKQIHALCIKIDVEMDVRVGTSLIDMYFNCFDPECGLKLFDRTHNPNLVMWGTVISNCARSGYPRKALELYVAGFEYGFLDSMTLLAALRACSSLTLKPEGMVIHGMAIKLGFDLDTYVGSALVDMYAKCQDMASSQSAFLRLPVKDDISWSSLISGYAQNEYWGEAMKSFLEMHRYQVKPNAVLISSLLSICAHVFTNLQCKEIHNYIIRQGFGTNILVNNSLIAAYAKCGNLKSSERVFLHMEDKDEVSWNSMMLGLGHHGHVNDMFAMFEKMQDIGFNPDHQTFTAILSACSHTGRVVEGLEYFKSMTEEHKLEPKVEQYTCLVDLLGRAGYLDQAYDLIVAMPDPTDGRVWGSLLGSCRSHGDERLAEVVASHVFVLDPASVGYRVLLANLYEDSGKWDEVSELRSEIRDMGLRKSPGCSWIDVGNQIHVFTASDESHQEVEGIYAVLKSLTVEMKWHGYAPQL